MSTIQSHFSIVHADSGLNVASAVQRTAFESGFSSSSVSVNTTEEQVLLGDLITPRQVCLKLVSGSPLQVGLATGVYPLRLTDPGESMMLRLDVEGRQEKSTITTVADVSGSLAGKYFDLRDRTGLVRVWFNQIGASPATTPPSAGGGRLLPVDFATNATNIAMAVNIALALDEDDEFIATSASNVVTITDQYTGTRTNVSAGDSTMTVATTQEGSASPTVYLQSTGVSQVVVVVAPN